MSELPLLEDALYAAARRRRRRRRARPVVALVLVALVATGALITRPHEQERVATPPWPTTTKHGVKVTLPSGWFVAQETLTPRLSQPREVLSVATFPLAYAEGRCNHQPDGAAARMTPRDAFITLQERRAGGLFGPRPARFRPALGSRLYSCLPATEGLMFEFSDAGRSFHALVYIGREASQRTKAQAFQILDRMEIQAR
jgi:hypothetical protein